MEIDTKVAQRIVDNLKGVIPHDINYINSKGIIVASSNETRIGTFHSASLLVFIEGRKIVVESDEEYEGVKAGVNLPVYFEGSIIGCIGITGHPNEVQKFDEIIKTMTEALVYQSFLKTRSRMKSYLKRQIFKQFLIYPNPEINVIVGKAKLVDVNLAKYRRVLIGKIKVETDKIDLQTQVYIEDIYNKFKFSIKKHIDAETSLMDDVIVCMISSTSDDRLEEIIQSVLKRTGTFIKLGIGTEVKTSKDMRESYLQADEALTSIRYMDTVRYVYYNQLDMEIIYKEIPDYVKNEFVHRVIGNLDEKELDLFLTTIDTYYQCNGSINQTAELLFIHKNTLQYRLNKLKELTGYNPRELKDGYVLYTALRLHKTKNNENQ